jgi:hypothetical protein
MMFNKKMFLILFAALATLGSCKKSYLETKPTDKLPSTDLLGTTTAGYTALRGIARYISSDNAGAYPNTNGRPTDFGNKGMDLGWDVMGNDMVCTSSTIDWFSLYYNYEIFKGSTYWGPAVAWNFLYKVVNNANNIIANIDAAAGPQEERDDIKGQALAYRAWAYSRLVTQFSISFAENPGAKGVPLYLEPTTPTTVGKPRGTVQQVYDQMTLDLEQAVVLLANAPSHEDDKSFISLAAAQGIYARVALASGKWATARQMAIRARTLYPLMSADQYTTGFNNISNSEWIWGSKLSSEQYTQEGFQNFFSFMDPNSPGYANGGAVRSITKTLYDTIPSADVRKQCFASNFLQNKFRTQSAGSFVGDLVYMRSAEMYLINAEASYRLGDESEAKDVLDELVTNRNASYSSFYAKPRTGVTPTLLDEILLQRRIELWGEGFAYSDIRRLKQPLARPRGNGNHSPGVATVLTMPANDNRFLCKIPQAEMDANKSLTGADQN